MPAFAAMSVEELLAWNDRQRALVGGWREWREEHDLLAEGLASSLLAELPRYWAEAAAEHVPAEKVPFKEREAPVEEREVLVEAPLEREELTDEDSLLLHAMVTRACEAAAEAQEAVEARAAAEAEARARAVVAPTSAPVAKAPKEEEEEETARWLDQLDRPHPPLEVGEQGEFACSGSEGSVCCRFASASHIGGSGKNRQKENQDACFVVRGERTIVWGVLDGHGPDNGRLAAHAGARAFKAWFAEHDAELDSLPEETMLKAFRAAHDAIHRQIVRRYERQGEPLKPGSGGFLVADDGQPVDGGATATVVGLVQGHVLVVANVGDSDAVLGGKLPDGQVGFQQLAADHSPTSADEFVRVAKLVAERGEGWNPPVFAYTAGDDDEPLEIFAMRDDGTVELDAESLQQLEACDAGFKTARGDRPTSIIAPETVDYEPCQLGVTRSLGDFYMQHYGITWEPAVSCIDLNEVASQLEHVTLVIASDGLWDLWEYKDVLQYHLSRPPPADSGAVLSPLLELVESTRRQSEEFFGESADNITAVAVTVTFGESSASASSQPAEPLEEVLDA